MSVDRKRLLRAPSASRDATRCATPPSGRSDAFRSTLRGGKVLARKVTPRADSIQTRERILAAAERLFAAAGFDGVSMRQVGAEADVPFALVSYHFETKLGLYKAVFRRRAHWISLERVDRLRDIHLTSTPQENFVAIARALVMPLMQVSKLEGGRDFTQLMSREVHDPVGKQRGIVEEHLDPVARETIKLIRQAAPEVPLSRVYWAYHFATGALAVVHAQTGRIERLSGGVCDSEATDEVENELILFLAAGLAGALLGPTPQL